MAGPSTAPAACLVVAGLVVLTVAAPLLFSPNRRFVLPSESKGGCTALRRFMSNMCTKISGFVYKSSH
ncbi:uncharacterized protein PHACADRAFT_250652 [Phanerochaete carnosa HHB-10118-sp]|uniref:Uncharacterized protein n=1 Tax=Phanerochaete carnosa (strain HHB-10118-sp) TaxID=650164 RepID=K5W7G7_PHACS|nr:uncharacterized protein PHACADRAFT_250652 [Phanerochaete carnosa HHB-10118-sp]EKM59873.1 hypothetical protein PHACADRAFT_250652 [Phanerochaete carnosa HHB-10118-sp]